MDLVDLFFFVGFILGLWDQTFDFSMVIQIDPEISGRSKEWMIPDLRSWRHLRFHN